MMLVTELHEATEARHYRNRVVTSVLYTMSASASSSPYEHVTSDVIRFLYVPHKMTKLIYMCENLLTHKSINKSNIAVHQGCYVIEVSL